MNTNNTTNNTTNNNTNYFKVISRPAPLIQGGHPVSYLTIPQSSILDPYNNAQYFFPTTIMDQSQFKHYGDGFYATQFSQQSGFRQSDFMIGVKIGRF